MNDFRFRHNTQDCLDPIFSCDHSLEPETLSLYYCRVHQTLKENLHEIGCNISELSDQSSMSLLFQ